MGFCRRSGLPVAGAFFVLIILFSMLKLQGSFEPPYLLAILNTLFIGIIQISVAYQAAKAYVTNNFRGALLMSCSLFIFGFAAILAGWLMYLPNGQNLSVTVFCCSVFAAAILHLMSSTRGKQNDQICARTRRNLLALSITTIIVCFTALILLVQNGIIPPFVDQSGFTVWRQVVLWSAIFHFLVAAIIYFGMYKRNKAIHIYWYSISLLLTAIGLCGVAVSIVIGDTVSWLGRLAQYAGGVYAYMFVLSANEQARQQSVELSNIISDFFVDAEESYKSVTETSVNAIVLFDQDFRIMMMNTAAEKMFGYSMKEAKSQSFLELFLPQKHRALMREDLQAYMEHGVSILTGKTVEMEVINKEGNRFPADLSISVRKLPTAYVCTCVIYDISAHKQTESTVQRQNTILRAINRIYEKSVTCATLQELGEACLTEVESITGSRLSFVGEIGQDALLHDIAISETGWEQCAMYDKSGHRRTPGSFNMHGLYGSVLNTGRSLLTNDPSAHIDSVSVPEGHPGLTAFMGVPFLRNGKVEGIICAANREGGYRSEDLENLEAIAPTVFEVLLRKRAEVAHRESEHLLRVVMEGIPQQFYLVDTEQRVVMCNTACQTYTQVHPDEMLGKDTYGIFPDRKFARMIKENDLQVIRENRTIVFEESPPNGRTYLTTKTPWRDADGNILGIIGISHDITDRKTMEEEIKRNAAELEQRNKSMTEFFTNISHELKTPLAIILIQLELMRQVPQEDKISKCVASATQNAFRLTRLIGNILDMAKIDTGYMKPRLVNTDIVALVADICKSVDPYAKPRFIQMRMRTPLVIKTMPTDTEKMERILLNLLSNAIKHTQSNGRITVSLKEKNDGGVVIAVKDTGEGIPEHKQEIIFDRFAQADTSLSRKAEGSGIGLALTKSMVEMLGGTIRVVSKEGEGCEFIVELPLLPTELCENRMEIISFDLSRKTAMELSDIY